MCEIMCEMYGWRGRAGRTRTRDNSTLVVITRFIPGRGLPCGGQENAHFGLSFLIEKLFH